MTLTKNKLAKYHKQCEYIERIHKKIGSKKNARLKQLSKQRREAEKLLKMLSK